MTWSREEMLSVVQRSPSCVAAQDKEGWLALFSRAGVVEDPVGAAPNQRAALGRFYETFIAGNEIAFEVIEDLWTEREVVRDVVIHTRLSTGLRVEVPAHLIYELVEEEGALRILRLRAVWDLRQRSLGALSAGLRGLWTLCAVSLRMLRVQGLLGVFGYSRGLVSGIFGRGPARVERLCAAISAGDMEGAAALFVPEARVEFRAREDFRAGAREDLPLRVWLAQLGAGTSVRASHVVAAGWVTTFRFALTGGPHDQAGGVALLEFDPKTAKISDARFFVRDVPQSR